MTITYEIKAKREFTHEHFDGAAMTPLGGSMGVANDVGLGDYQFEIDVAVTNNGKTESFTVALQPVDRNDNLEAFNGHELRFAASYGCDADESEELLKFCDYDRIVLDELHGIATAASKAELERLINERDAAAKAILAAMDAGQDFEVSLGVYICSASDMAVDQKGWDDEDPNKHTDFSTSAYWVTTDSGDDPEALDSTDDLLALCNRLEVNVVDVAANIQRPTESDPFVQGEVVIQPSN